MRFGWLTLSLSPSPEEDAARIEQQIEQVVLFVFENRDLAGYRDFDRTFVLLFQHITVVVPAQAVIAESNKRHDHKCRQRSRSQTICWRGENTRMCGIATHEKWC